MMHTQVQRNESPTTDKLKHIGHSLQRRVGALIDNPDFTLNPKDFHLKRIKVDTLLSNLLDCR
jgi:hypothetical protein